MKIEEISDHKIIEILTQLKLSLLSKIPKVISKTTDKDKNTYIFSICEYTGHENELKYVISTMSLEFRSFFYRKSYKYFMNIDIHKKTRFGYDKEDDILIMSKKDKNINMLMKEIHTIIFDEYSRVELEKHNQSINKYILGIKKTVDKSVVRDVNIDDVLSSV